MGTNILKIPIARLACRGFSTQAMPSAHESTSEGPQITCSALPNKVLVASIDLCGALSRLSVYFRTGSRNEVYKNAGITHVIRSLAGKSTLEFTDFFILRNIQQNGALFTCTGDREFTAYNLVATRNLIPELFLFMASITSNPAYKPWQVKRHTPQLKYELSLVTPKVRTMEMLHKAAYRTGLGNSLFIKKDFLGVHDENMLHEFYTNGFTCGRALVVGYNLTHKDVVNFAESFTLNKGDPPEGNSTYFGGEIRKERNSHFTTMAIATQGTGLKDHKEALAYGILQHAMGVDSTILWGGSPSPLYKALAAVSPSIGGSCFNISYSDSGLFGIIINCVASDARAALEAAYKVLRSGQITDADMKRGRALLKMKLLDNASYSDRVMEDIAVQSLIGGVVVPATVLAEAVDKVTIDEVQLAAKKIASGKLSMASYGNLGEVPYLDELK